jgi:cytidylate kinase
MQRRNYQAGGREILIGIVGPCAAGKSTLIAELRKHGYKTKHIAQEHSYVPDMWRKITNPDILIYLDVTYPVSMQRRKLDWNEAEFLRQVERLRNARQHADLYIQTDHLSISDVRQRVFQFLTEAG